ARCVRFGGGGKYGGLRVGFAHEYVLSVWRLMFLQGPEQRLGAGASAIDHLPRAGGARLVCNPGLGPDQGRQGRSRPAAGGRRPRRGPAASATGPRPGAGGGRRFGTRGLGTNKGSQASSGQASAASRQRCSKPWPLLTTRPFSRSPTTRRRSSPAG